MKKFLKWFLIVVLVIAVAGFVMLKRMQSETKKASPEQLVELNHDGLELDVFYNRPYKKDREIFGGLVPYGKVWRTGANEATTFSCNEDILVHGELLKEGVYTLWTIPNKDSWEVIFNSKSYGWGVTWGGEPSRDPDGDVLKVNIPITPMDDVTEQFTIALIKADPLLLQLTWDQTQINVPIDEAD